MTEDDPKITVGRVTLASLVSSAASKAEREKNRKLMDVLHSVHEVVVEHQECLNSLNEICKMLDTRLNRVEALLDALIQGSASYRGTKH